MSNRLLTDVESLDQVRVALCVLRFQIVEQPTAAADEHQQAAARVMIFCVRLEMLSEVVDSFAEECNLNFWRTGIAVVSLVRAD